MQVRALPVWLTPALVCSRAPSCPLLPQRENTRARWACCWQPRWHLTHATITTPSMRPLPTTVGEKARTLGLLLAAGGGYTLWAHLPLEQALNGLISVLVFNIMYDLLIS